MTDNDSIAVANAGLEHTAQGWFHAKQRQYPGRDGRDRESLPLSPTDQIAKILAENAPVHRQCIEHVVASDGQE